MSLLRRSDWREFAVRKGDRLEISMHWSKYADRIKVCIVDQRRDASFDLHVDGPDALGAFCHPVGYAAGRGGFLIDLAQPASLDLQLQS